MNRDGYENAKFFTGIEIEHTPVHGHVTMFVIGIVDQEQLNWQIGTYNQKHKNPITHIYFGANHSFPNPDINHAETWSAWEQMITPWLDRGYWCTLDVDVKSVEGLCEGVLCEYAQFIPMISVKMPYLRLLGYNATVKIDDRDFDSTNPGVWCHSLHDLLNRDRFTSWNQYTKDQVL